MAHHHPDIHMLTEFSAGVASPGIALCIAAHIDYCPQCRNQARKLEALGGALFEIEGTDHEGTVHEGAVHEGTVHEGTAQPSALDAALEKTLAAIDKLEAAAVSGRNNLPETNASRPGSSFPDCLRSLIPAGLEQLNWKKIGASLRVARLDTGDRQHEVALHQLQAGGGVADHDHRGQEITVVLKGSFSDQNGLYMPGDFLVRNAGEAHAPKASNDGDCICLSTMAAPVRFTGLLTRLVNPFLRIYPSTSS